MQRALAQRRPALGVARDVVVVEPVVARSARASRRARARRRCRAAGRCAAWHFSAVSVRRGSMQISFAPARLACLRVGPEVQVRGDRVAAPDEDQPALGVVLDVHADLARRRSRPAPRRRPRSRSCGRAARRRAGGRSAPPCSRPAAGPSCRRSCTARSPRRRAVGPGDRLQARGDVGERLVPADRARTGRCPSARRAAADAAPGLGDTSARGSATPSCTAPRASVGCSGSPCTLTARPSSTVTQHRAGVGTVVRAGGADVRSWSSRNYRTGRVGKPRSGTRRVRPRRPGPRPRA